MVYSVLRHSQASTFPYARKNHISE